MDRKKNKRNDQSGNWHNQRENLNYDVPRNVPQSVPRNVPRDNIEGQIISLIQKNNKISTEKMAMILGISSKTIKRHIKQMDHVNYIGRRANGHWEISEEE